MTGSEPRHSARKGTYYKLTKALRADGTLDAQHSSEIQQNRRLLATAGMTMLAITLAASSGAVATNHHGDIAMAAQDPHRVTATADGEVSRSSARDALDEGTWSLAEDMKIPYSQTSNEADALSSLKKLIDDGSSLYDSSNGKVADDSTRSKLKDLVDKANGMVKGKSSDTAIDVDAFNKVNNDLTDAINAVNESVSAKQQADAQKAVQSQSYSTSSSGGSSSLGTTAPVGEMQQWFHDYLLSNGYTESDFSAGVWIINHESGWNVHATNASSGAYGLPQSLPGSKMASAGADWQNNYQTQLKWFISYCNGRYGGIAGAYSFWQTHNYY